MFQVDIIPQPAPRPRVSMKRIGGKQVPQVYYPNGYHEYKKQLSAKLLELNIPRKDYSLLFVEVGYPYPKATAKKRLIEGFPHRSNYDCDNVVKPLMDCLEKVEVIENDRQIYELRVRKVYTCTRGYIKFYLGIYNG